MSRFTPRLTEARREIGRLRHRIGWLVIQRNMLKDQRDRMALAIVKVNVAYSRIGRPTERERALAEALNEAVALLKVATEYDAVQSMTDPTYPVQEN